MKENLDNQEENENEELLYDESIESENKKIPTEIDLNIYNSKEKKLENYKLLNEEEEMLLVKEEVLNTIKSQKENKEEDIKIKELYNGEDNDSLYYLNKKELKKRYFKLETNLNEDQENQNSIFDNQNEKEMEKLYKEIQLKHPRKIVDRKITRYSFFSCSGFFCCNNSDYIPLGQTYVTYFNTIKLLIIFFFLISLINIPLMVFYSKFTSIF